MKAMLKYFGTALLLVSAASFSCSCRKSEPRQPIVTADNISMHTSSHKYIVPADSSIVWLDMSDGYAKATILKKADQCIHIKFDCKDKKQMQALLSSDDDDANIRIYEIIRPDGTLDGPFGKSLLYDLEKDGTYVMKLKENIMAGDPWKGHFTIELTWLEL